MRAPARFAIGLWYARHGEKLLPPTRVLSCLRSCLFSLLMSGSLCVASAEAEAAYSAVEFANLPEVMSIRVTRGLNDNGEVAGGARLGNRQRAFVLDSGGPRNVDLLPDGDYNVAFGINNHGELVGSANTATGVRAFRAARTGGVIDLGTLPGDSSSEAFAVNHRGDVVGYSSGPTGARAVVWSGGAVQALPAFRGSDSCQAHAINDPGDIVGVCEMDSGARAVLWKKGGGVEALQTLAGHAESEALGINPSGDIVGSSGDPDGATSRGDLGARFDPGSRHAGRRKIEPGARYQCARGGSWHFGIQGRESGFHLDKKGWHAGP